MMKLLFPAFLLLSFSLFMLFSFSYASQINNLQLLLKTMKSEDSSVWGDIEHAEKFVYPSVCVAPQEGLMYADKIDKLPGQPDVLDFNQYAGYVTVDHRAGRSLFYYFAESPIDSATNPLLLWLNGGPGCSSFGYGAMQELGPFGVKSNGKNLYERFYAWNYVANVIFLESPVGVGFSYSNTTSDYYDRGDSTTARDNYLFLLNWLERFPQYKSRELYLAGESFAGHYVPELALTILANNMYTNNTKINLKGIAIGNALIDDQTVEKGRTEFFWSHALISDEAHEGFTKNCDFLNRNSSQQCPLFENKIGQEIGHISMFNIYKPLFCQDPLLKNGSFGLEKTYGPCSETYVDYYLSLPEVQAALHAIPTAWSRCCSISSWGDWPSTILPIIEHLSKSGISVWIYSGDTDAVIPVTSTRSALNSLKLPIKTPWRPWYTYDDEVGGYVVEYGEGLTFATVKGAGHMVPSDKPMSAFIMISAFLQGILLPSK